MLLYSTIRIVMSKEVHKTHNLEALTQQFKGEIVGNRFSFA
jgi:hypothetical protein